LQANYINKQFFVFYFSETDNTKHMSAMLFSSDESVLGAGTKETSII